MCLTRDRQDVLIEPKSRSRNLHQPLGLNKVSLYKWCEKWGMVVFDQNLVEHHARIIYIVSIVLGEENMLCHMDFGDSSFRLQKHQNPWY